MTYIIMAFCIVLIEGAPAFGGASNCNFYKPPVRFVTEEQCVENKKIVEDRFLEEARRLFPKAIKITAKGVCIEPE